PRPFADLRVVTRRAAVGGAAAELRVRVAQHLPREPLRRLRAPDALPIDGAGDAWCRPIGTLADFLERVGGWDCGDGTDAGARACDHRVDGLAAHERPGGNATTTWRTSGWPVNGRSARSSIGTPRIGRNCFGSPGPARTPAPAATTTTPTSGCETTGELTDSLQPDHLHVAARPPRAR